MYRVVIRSARTTAKGELIRETKEVESLDELPETIPCNNPDCAGGTMPLREAAKRAATKPAHMSRMRCSGGREKSGLQCWNIVDVYVNVI